MIEKVKEYFKKFNIENKILEFDESSATVELASKALGVEGGRIAKTLSFDVNGKTVLIVVAGDRKIDNAKFKSFFGVKAKMLKFEEVEVRVGHSVGGVCPFAVNEGVDVYLDNSLKSFATIFPACGSLNSAIELTPTALEKYSNPKQWIDVCKQFSV